MLLAIKELKVESRETDPLYQEKKAKQEFLLSLTGPWEPKATAISPTNTREKAERLSARKQPCLQKARLDAASLGLNSAALDSLLTTNQVAELLGISPLTIHRRRCAGNPVLPAVEVLPRRPRYRLRDVLKLIEQSTAVA